MSTQTNELLEEKWKTQRKMAAKADYDIKKMLDNAEETVAQMVKDHGTSLKYATIKPSVKNEQDLED
jgi:hypothetical protein